MIGDVISGFESVQVEESRVVLNEDEQVDNNDDDFDISSLLLFEDNDFLFAITDDGVDSSQSSSSSLSDPKSISSIFRDIEDKLLNDNEQEEEELDNNNEYLVDEFFSDLQLPCSLLDNVSSPPQLNSSLPSSRDDQDILMDDLLVDVPLTHINNDYSPSHSSSDQVVTTTTTTMEAPVTILNDPETSTPESQVSIQYDDDENDNYKNDQELEQEKTSFNASQEKEKARPTTTTSDSAAMEDKEDDDPITKKRKRQMRNRDAAVRSRERKKLYVKDLEIKSKYLEGECIRLQRLLQCCAAENHALHLQLQEKAFSASRTMQESAVLLESLLLGSLLWFLGILAILGLLSPEILRVQPPADLLLSTENQKVVDLVALGKAKSKSIGLGTLRLFFKSKRCKASRSKMKIICNAAVAA